MTRRIRLRGRTPAISGLLLLATATLPPLSRAPAVQEPDTPAPREAWNEVFRETREADFPWKPNAFLVRTVAGLELHAVVEDLGRFDYGEERWDPIVVM
jgi:hypothetical protein